MLHDRFRKHRLEEEEVGAALKAAIALLESEESVSFAYLHGSVVDLQRRRQTILPHDIDVAIYLSEGDWVTVELRLQSEFYMRTGLSPEVFDVHTLNNAPVTVAMEIIKHGKLLFCRDPLQHAEYVEAISNSRRRLAGILEVAHA